MPVSSMKPTAAVAKAHIFLSENDPFPRFNGAVLSIVQITKFGMASAAESERAALVVTAREMVPHRQTLIAMGWPQPKSPIQTDNSIAAGATNRNIVPHRVKMLDMRLSWLRCRGSQNQFRYYWNARSKTGPSTIPSTTWTPTTKCTKSRMLESGSHQANSPCATLAKTLAHGFPS